MPSNVISLGGFSRRRPLSVFCGFAPFRSSTASLHSFLTVATAFVLHILPGSQSVSDHGGGR
jgi:hypothetical protein